jgi:aminopeptidase-like protein
MTSSKLERSWRSLGIGEEIYELIGDLYPLCRSITGNGVRETLRVIGQHIPLEIHEIATGTQVFDWTVPREWNIKHAYIKEVGGDKVVDFQKCNLHVVSYSVPVQKTIPIAELKSHLFTLPDHPDWIPYRTSYYQDSWGFCISHNQYQQLTKDEYEVVIDSSLEDGHLTYGECYIKGRTNDEILISTHVCHPSLCNDNLSGLALATVLAKDVRSVERRYSYRFLFIPVTIGSIVWLARNEDKVLNIKHGLVLTCVGDPGKITYKRSRRGTADVDRAMAHVLQHSGGDSDIVDFVPYGYDERQFCSPGFDLPVGCLMRTPNGRFPEYHTSADNLDFVQPGHLGDSFAKAVTCLSILEDNRIYVNQNPKCEPQLGKRGLYRAMAGNSAASREMAMLWVLNYSDGEHGLLDIAERSALPFDSIKDAAEILVANGLLQEKKEDNNK